MNTTQAKSKKPARSIYSSKRLTPEQRAEIAAAPDSVRNIELMRKFDTTYATVMRYRNEGKNAVAGLVRSPPMAQARIEETPQKFIFTIDKSALIRAALGSLQLT